MKKQLKLTNSNKEWSANGRYNVNTVVGLDGIDYQNITGKNSIPSDLQDWVLVNEVGNTQQYKSSSFTAENGIFYIAGGTTLTVTDPTTEIVGQGFIVYASRYSVTIDSITYSPQCLVYRFYTADGWISKDITNTSIISDLNTNKVDKGVNNTTTVALTSANLNSAYPDAETGFKVYCTSIVAGKMVYEKTPTGWVGMAVIVP